MAILSVVALFVWGGDYPKAIRVAVESTVARKSVPDEGMRLYDRENYEDAIEQYESGFGFNPDNVAALYELSLPHLSRKEYADALPYVQKGITYISDLRPDFFCRPFFIQMKAQGFTDVFACRIHSGNPDAEVGKWPAQNSRQVEAFMERSSNYPWP